MDARSTFQRHLRRAVYRKVIFALTCALLIACAAPAKRVLFINGDFVPESGAPESRVFGASDATSFVNLRADVLERELNLRVEEFVLTRANAITSEQLKPYAVVVLGSNGRALSADEIIALQSYLQQGGSILIYADFQYGPDNWASDNSLLREYGIEVLPDNFQPRTQITDIVAPSHSIMSDIRAIEAEGISQFRILPAAREVTQVLMRCSPLNRSGCVLQPEVQTRVGNDDVVCVWVRDLPNAGRLAGVCDRNLFHNGPQKDGTDLNQADNKRFSRNLFRWLARL